MNAQSAHDLLLDLYRCPTERSRWPVVLDQICRATHSRSAVIQLLAKDGDRAWSRWVVRDSASEAARDEHERMMGDAVNPRLNHSRQRALPEPRGVIRDNDFFAPDDPAREELQERLAALGLGHFMSVGVRLPADERLVLVLHRDIDQRRDFERAEECFALGLIPHLNQAVRLSEQLDAAKAHGHDLEQAINRVRCALLLCSPEGRVCWANQAAEQILARRDRLWSCGERLTTASMHETVALRRAIAEAASDAHAPNPSPNHFLVLGRSSASLQVMIQAVPDDHGGSTSTLARRPGQHRVLLILSDPGEPPTLPAEIIGRVFALSPAESRLAAALCGGMTVGEYASTHGVTIGTARFQLKQVLAKTNTSRQSNLIRQMCSSVVAHALPGN